MTRALARIVPLLLLTVSAWAQSTVELLDAGAAPRAPLRYQYQPGSTERVTMEMQISMVQEVNGQQRPMNSMPATRTVMETRVTEVAPDGSARIEMVTRSAEAAPGPTDSQTQGHMDESLAGMSRLVGWYRVDARGRTIEGNASQNLAAGATPESQATMDRVLGEVNGSMQNEAAMFPEEPVGVGARWRVTTAQAFMGVNVEMVQHYTLRKRTGNILELDMESAGPNLDTGSGALAGGQPIEQSGSMKGTATVHLQRLNPAMTMQMENDTAMGVPGQPGAMRMKMQMRMSLTPEVL